LALRVGAGSGRKPMHQPSRRRTRGGVVGEVQGQVEGGRRSTRPENASLEYCGMGIGVAGLVVRAVRKVLRRGRSWVPGGGSGWLVLG
jgi:hypothetical protein